MLIFESFWFKHLNLITTFMKYAQHYFYLTVSYSHGLLDMCWDLPTNGIQIVGLHSEQWCSGKAAPVSVEKMLLRPQSAAAHYHMLLHEQGKYVILLPVAKPCQNSVLETITPEEESFVLHPGVLWVFWCSSALVWVQRAVPHLCNLAVQCYCKAWCSAGTASNWVSL